MPVSAQDALFGKTQCVESLFRIAVPFANRYRSRTVGGDGAAGWRFVGACEALVCSSVCKTGCFEKGAPLIYAA